MASNRIPVNTSATTTAQQFANVLTQLQQVQDDVINLFDIGEQAAAGGDFAAFNDLIIGGGVPAGVNADTVYNLLAGLKAALTSSAVTEPINRMGTR